MRIVFSPLEELTNGVRTWNEIEIYFYDQNGKLFRQNKGSEIITFADLNPELKTAIGIKSYLEGLWNIRLTVMGSIGHLNFSKNRVRFKSAIADLPDELPALTDDTSRYIFDFFHNIPSDDYQVEYRNNMEIIIEVNGTDRVLTINPVYQHRFTSLNGAVFLRKN